MLELIEQGFDRVEAEMLSLGAGLASDEYLEFNGMHRVLDTEF